MGRMKRGRVVDLKYDILTPITGGAKMKQTKIASAVVISMMLAFALVANAAEFTMKFANPVSKEHSWGKAAEKFAELVTEATKGRVLVQAHHAGTLGQIRETLEMARVGTVDFVVAGTGHVTAFTPEIGITVLPYLWKNTATMFKALDGPFGAVIDKALAKQGLALSAWWDNGFRHMTNSVRAINTPEDMKGLKIRVVQSEMSINIINALGGNAVPMSYSELYTALSQKVVDGQENPFMNIYASKFYEVQKYMSVTKHQYSTLPIIMSDKTWKKLDENQRKIIQKVALESAAYMRKKVGANEDSQRKAMEAAGMKVNDVKDLAAFRKTQEPVYEWAKKKWGAERVSAVMTEVEKYRKMYPAGSTYFGLSDKKK